MTDKTEGELLLPLVQDEVGLGVKVSPLDLLILACFSLTAAHYKLLRENGLVHLFPRLFRAIVTDVEMDEKMRATFVKLIREACRGQECGTRLLSKWRPISPFRYLQIIEAVGLDAPGLETHESLSQAVVPNSSSGGVAVQAQVAMPVHAFEYSGLDILTIQPLLGTSLFLQGIQKSRGWLWEREHDNPDSLVKLTYSVKARVKPDLLEDMEFRIRVGWDHGWYIINSLGFQSCLPIQTVKK